MHQSQSFSSWACSSNSPSSRPSSRAPIRQMQHQRLFVVVFMIAVSLPATAFRTIGNGIQRTAFDIDSALPSRRSYGGISKQQKSSAWPQLGFHTARKSSPFVTVMSVSNRLDSNIEELESLHKTRQSPPLSEPEPQTEEESTPKEQAVNKQESTKPTIKFILNKPVGELTASSMNSLCNSIRHNRKGSSFYNLQILERILLELDHWNSFGKTGGPTYLKPIHVFSLLTALSSDIKAWKNKGGGKRKKPINRPLKVGTEKISGEDVQRLVAVVTLLSQQRHSNSLDPGCYTKDVPSFATMIAAEASRWDKSAVDASLLFLDMVEKDEGGDSEWDPRLVGAVLDAMARAGRAEEARTLLGGALGIDIPVNKEGPSDGAVVSAGSKRLNPAKAGPCYNSLLRSYSKQALVLANEAEPGHSRRQYPNAKRKNNAQASTKKLALAKLSLEHARHILLHHIPLQPELKLSNRTVTAVLQGYSSLGLGEESKRLLMELEGLDSKLDVACYNSVLHACSQSQDSGDVATAEGLFMAMKEQTPLEVAAASSSLSFTPPEPDYISFSSMLNCYSKHGMASKAEALLNEMHENFRPNVACYLPIIQALERSNDVDAADRALVWLDRSGQSLAKPNRLLYTTALRCMARHGRGEDAELLLGKFLEAFPNYGGPDVYSYTLVLRAWEKTKVKADRQMAAEKAEIFFEKMEQLAEESILPYLDVNAYNILLNCYARAGDTDKASNLLTDMEGTLSTETHDEYAAKPKPNNKSYSLGVKALANSDVPVEDVVSQAWRTMYRLGYPRDLEPRQPLEDTVPFNVSIGNFNSMLKLFGKRGMASEAEAMLSKMDELIVDGVLKTGNPDIQSYEAVLEALGRCKDADAPTRAEALMTRLEVMSEMGGDSQPKPSLLAYNTLLNCYANAGMAGKAERLLERLDDPDSFSVGSTIKAIANSGKSEAVSISHADSLVETLGPGNEVIFAHRLKLCAKFGQGELAEELIRKMGELNLHPSVIHYTTALNAWAKNSDDDAISRAEALFKKMGVNFDLDRGAYHGLLLNYSTRGKSKQAWRLLQKMQDLPNVKLNRNSFTMVMDAYARSKSKHAGDKAEALLDEMRRLHAAGNRDVEPDTVTYASLIRCKQVSENKKPHDLTPFDKLQLMQQLQMESWPFDD